MKFEALFINTCDYVKKRNNESEHKKIPEAAVPAVTSFLISAQYLYLTPWKQYVVDSANPILDRIMDFYCISSPMITVVYNILEELNQHPENVQYLSQTLTTWRKKELDRFDVNGVHANLDVPKMVREWQTDILRDPQLKEFILFADFIQQVRFVNTSSHQKQLGSYYTPIGVILYILERMTDNLVRARCPNNIFMDYACGMGNFVFITAALLELIAHDPQLQERDQKICKWEFVGLDIDSDAIKFAHILRQLLIQHPKYGSVAEHIHLQESDSLNALPQILCQNIGLEAPPEFQENCVDLILSNPPYVSWGLGRVDKLQKTREQLYRTRFANSAEYKISFYALFIERAVQLLRSGGMAGLIIPDSFLTGKYFAKLRNFLLNETWIREIVLFPKSFWKHADSGDPVILIFQKKLDTISATNLMNQTPEILVKSASLDHNLVKINQKNLMTPEYFRAQSKQRFRLFFTPDTMIFVQAMEKNAVSLGTYFEIHHGIRSKTGIGKSRIVSSQRKGAQWKPGLIAGNSVVPFHIEYRGHFLLTNPEYLFSGGFDPQQIEQEKIIIRRTGDHIIAAVDERGLYHSNTLIYLIPRAQSFHALSLYALCAILNSQVMNQYYQYISLKAKRSMAQVEIDTLEQLPLKGDPSVFAELDKFGRELHRVRNEWNIHSSTFEQQKTWNELEQLANLLIKNTYFRQV